MDRMLDGSQSWPKHGVEVKILLMLPEIKPQFLGHPAMA
jgi:hypothetical protein